jgi:hypothetical protein
MRSAAVREILAKVGLLPRKDLPRPEEQRVVRGRTIRQFLALVVLIVMASLAGPSLAPAPAHASGPAGNELIQIPLRWCALSGTKAVTNPGSFGEPNTTSVLLRRQERASNQIWIPGANVIFRSPFPAAVPASSAQFPVIGDPGPPPVLGSADGLNGPGQNGDILFPDSVTAAAEYELARSECEEEWDHLAQPPPVGLGVSMKGPIALNFGRFVDASGNPVGTLGLGIPPAITGSVPFAQCEIPPVHVTAAGETFMGVVDFSAVGAKGRDAQVVAHELGHVLTLGHGNGLDDNNNKRYDLFCDPSEAGLDSPPTIMHPSGISNDVTALQRDQSRTIAKLTPGSQIDPPFELVNADTLSDRRVDDAQDVKDASVDMTGVGMMINAKQKRVILSHTLSGLISKGESTEYAAFLDLDSDQTTGGRPAELGFPTRFKGAELVTRVRVQGGPIEGVHPLQLSEGRPATPTVWRFDRGKFVDVTKSGVTASVTSPVGEELPFPTFDVVSAQLPADVVGHVGSRVRLQAITAGKGKDWVDVLPGERPSRTVPAGSAVLFMSPPKFPSCTTTPDVVQPGDVVTIKAAGFDRPGEEGHVVLGSEPIGNVALDRARKMSADIAIPGETRGGTHLITIQVEDSALTADCALQVRGGGATALSKSGGLPLVGPGVVASLTVLAASVGALVMLLRRGVS